MLAKADLLLTEGHLSAAAELVRGVVGGAPGTLCKAMQAVS